MTAAPIAARYARATVRGWQLFWGAWGAAGMAMFAGGLLLGGTWVVLALPGAVLSAVAALFLRRMRLRFGDPAPVVTVTAEAYHDRRLGAPIPWAEVRSLRRHQPGNRIFLLIDTDRPERFLGNAGLLARPMQSLNPAMGLPAIGSRLDGLDVPQDDLAAAAESAWAARRPGPGAS